jgi:hypothetical protein
VSFAAPRQENEQRSCRPIPPESNNSFACKTDVKLALVAIEAAPQIPAPPSKPRRIAGARQDEKNKYPGQAPSAVRAATISQNVARHSASAAD